jgi:hypothetical protein
MNRRSTTLLSILAGILAAGLVFGAVWLFAGRGSTTTTTQAAATTTTGATTTTSPATTTSAGETTSTTGADTTTTTGATTTTNAFVGDTSPKSNDTKQGDPGPMLTDVRWGDHPEDGFVRLVFDFAGDGVPIYDVRYEDPPFVGGGSGEEVPVLGTAFLRVRVIPGTLYDIDSGDLVYTGDTTLDPGVDPLVEVQFIDDFEAYMTWVVGLTAEKAFTVEVMQDPLRLVIDIAK